MLFRSHETLKLILELPTLKKEPLKTLSKYRNVNNSVLFGTNIVSLNSGIINVGDEIVF